MKITQAWLLSPTGSPASDRFNLGLVIGRNSRTLQRGRFLNDLQCLITQYKGLWLAVMIKQPQICPWMIITSSSRYVTDYCFR